MIRDNTYRLSELRNGESGIIARVIGHGPFRRRISEMGFIRGKKVQVIKNAPLQDPIEYEIMGYRVSLRRREADMIEIMPVDEKDDIAQSFYAGTLAEDRQKMGRWAKTDHIKVALVGNPNSGKTTLFNILSGLHERVGNYGGVTVESKEAVIRKRGNIIKVVDLPGTYSITEYSPEELFVRRYIMDNKPDVVINVVDASNLERNLFLTTQLIDMNTKVIIALNMFDELRHKGTRFDYTSFGQLTGIPVIPTIANRGRGIGRLLHKVIDVYEDKDPVVRHIHIDYGLDIEGAINKLQDEIRKNQAVAKDFSTRYLAIKLLEDDKTTLKYFSRFDNYERIAELSQTEIRKMEKEYNEKSETVFTDLRYGFISGALKETCAECAENSLKKKHNIDAVLTHKYLGYPVFMFFMWLMFQATFTLGNYPMNWIEAGVSRLGNFVSTTIPAGAFHDLLIDGIIGGVGGVIVFLPNILILFFFISLMEDTGYMARVSFLMDKLMHKIGLHGKSFIPLLMGFGCNVPAIMATRTLENRKDRIMTMLITPFMSCSARLPVYVLIISAFFPKSQGLVLFSIYLTGIVLGILVSLLLKNTLFARQDVPFVMELPPYRIPTIRNTTRHMWHKGSQYLRKMGGVILVGSILIWALSYYPRKVNYSSDYDVKLSGIAMNTVIPDSMKKEQIKAIELQKMSEHQQKSYIGRLGRMMEPVLIPLGFDWKIGVSLLSGLAAKEIVVSTMGVLYHVDEEGDEHMSNLVNRLQQQEHTSGKLKGKKVFTPLVAFGFMLFILIYFPCIAVIAAINKESNWKWAVFTMGYTTALAWIVSWLTFNIGGLFI